jgi:WD40 repeat protein
VTSLICSRDGKRILTGSSDKTARVWDANKGTELLTLIGHTDWVMCVSWSPDGKHILTGSIGVVILATGRVLSLDENGIVLVNGQSEKRIDPSILRHALDSGAWAGALFDHVIEQLE